MGDFNTRRYTLVHGFFFFKLLFIGPKEVRPIKTKIVLINAHEGSRIVLTRSWFKTSLIVCHVLLSEYEDGTNGYSSKARCTQNLKINTM